MLNFADVEQPFLAGQHFDEYAEGEHTRDCSDEDLSSLDFADEVLDYLDGHSRGLFVDGGDADLAAVFDVDLRAGLLDYAADCLSAGADDVADFFRVDVEGDDFRGCRRKLGARLGYYRVHDVEYLVAAFLRLSERLCQYLACDAAGLVVHLERCYAIASAGYLEVHVSIMVFKALYVGEDADLSRCRR